jgi:integrase
MKSSRATKAETIKFLTETETQKLIGAISGKRDKAIFLLAYRHGLRVLTN